MTGSTPDPVLVAVLRCAGAASALTVTALLLFYALDLRTGSEHGFGPISDIGTVVWDVLVLPLLVGFRSVLGKRRSVDLLLLATALTTAVGALASAGLVADVLAFEVATPIAVLALLVQGLWLHVLSRRLRGTAWPLSLVRLGFWGPVAQAFGAAAFAGSLLLGWGTRPQLVVMVLGVAPGLLAWLSWPVWFLGAATALTRFGVPGAPPAQVPNASQFSGPPAGATAPVSSGVS